MKITVREYIAAIEKNGLPQRFGSLYEFDEEDDIVEACAIGQAHINLGLVDNKGQNTSKSNTVQLTDLGLEIETIAIELNDVANLTLAEIARELRDAYKSYLDKAMYKPYKP